MNVAFVKSLKLKKPSKLQAPKFQLNNKIGFAEAEGKLSYLIAFAVLYGLVFINYIDIASSGGAIDGYHLWLVLMYFLPFVGFSMLNLKNWQLTLGLGLIASLMNDVFYNLIRDLIGIHINLTNYYSLWLIPQNATLLNLNLGFAVISVSSWMMSLSIYLRVAFTVGLLWKWKIGATKNILAQEAETTKMLSDGLNYEPLRSNS